MKNKQKTVAIITVLFLSAIAATSGTFAWFVTNREASISFGEAQIYSDYGDLVVDYKSSLNTISTTPTKDITTNTLKIVANHTVTDISGDGLSFYKPVWADQSAPNKEDYIASEINAVSTSGAGVADGFFVDFTLTFSRSAGDTAGFKVFLGDETAILPKDDSDIEDIGIIDAIRMAVINYNTNVSTGTPSVTLRHSPTEEITPEYISPLVSGEIYEVPGYNLVEDTLLDHEPFTTESLIADVEYPPIADLTTDTSADVTFRFWIEGEDVDAKDEFIGGTFNVVLDVYALSA